MNKEDKNKYRVEPKFNCEYQEDIVCPHCGDKDTDHEVDYDEECQEFSCGACEKKFDIVVHKEVSFSSMCLEGEHDYVKDDFHIDDMISCSRCGESHFTRFNKDNKE